MGFRIYRRQATAKQKTRIKALAADAGWGDETLNDISKSEADRLIKELKEELDELEEIGKLMEANGWKS